MKVRPIGGANWQTLASLVVLVAFAGLLLHQLGSNPIWNDEGLSYFAAKDGIRQTLVRVASDTHAPFYYVLLSVWMNAGHDLFTLRIPSVMAGIVSVIFVYLSARALTDRGTAILAMALFAIAPANVDWAQHARPYSLQTMFVAISLWGFVRIVTSELAGTHLIGTGLAAALRNGRASGPSCDLAWFAYAVAGGLAMLTQHPAGFFVLGCNVVMAVRIFRDVRTNRLLLINWTIAQLVISVIWLSWLPAFLGQVSEHMTNTEMAVREPQFLVASLWPMFQELLSVAYVWRVQPWPLLLYVLPLIAGCYHAIRTTANIRWIYLAAASPLIVTTICYYAISPIFGYAIHTFHWFPVLTAILVAHGISVIGPRPVQVAAVALLALVNLKGLSNYYQQPGTSYADIANVIAAKAKAGDGIVFDSNYACRFGVAYYLEPNFKDMPGLDTSRLGDHLIRTPQAAAANRRNWVCAPNGEDPAVSFGDLAGIGRLGFEQRFDAFVLRRYDRAD